MKLLVFYLTLATATLAQQYTTPVPILKQINKHNQDGSYSYGYEGADGSFKIETKYPTGEVQGKYGYIDDTGKLREVEYGASRRGFEPAGTDINVPPPTLNNDNPYPLGPNDEDDGQYREDPHVYYKDTKYNSKRPAQQSYSQAAYVQPKQQQNYVPGPRQYYNNNVSPTEAPVYEPEPVFKSQPAFQHRFTHPKYNTQPQYNQPQPQYQQPRYQPNNYNNYNNHNNYNNFAGHPATNLDLNTGSYSLTYTG